MDRQQREVLRMISDDGYTVVSNNIGAKHRRLVLSKDGVEFTVFCSTHSSDGARFMRNIRSQVRRDHTVAVQRKSRLERDFYL